MTNLRKWVASPALALAFLPFLATPAHAVDKLYSPYVEQGEWELEYFGSRSVDAQGGKDDAQKQQFSMGYGVTEHWRTEVYAKYEKEPQKNLAFDAYEWENIFQLTEQGEYWLDAGASLAYEWTPQSHRADTVEARLLLAKDFDETSHLLNIILEKDVGSGPKADLEGALIWSSRYDYNSFFQPGFEINSDFGELKHARHFKDQEHYIGPAAYGKIPLKMFGQFDALKYRVGYLFGVSDAANQGQAIAQLEYELHL
ncbi:MAG: hypothetical protein HY053_04030 [Proteobacteria bacterium]|nr:hypothetical protein [Pseudomonadota bacterium]